MSHREIAAICWQLDKETSLLILGMEDEYINLTQLADDIDYPQRDMMRVVKKLERQGIVTTSKAKKIRFYKLTMTGTLRAKLFLETLKQMEHGFGIE